MVMEMKDRWGEILIVYNIFDLHTKRKVYIQ